MPFVHKVKTNYHSSEIGRSLELPALITSSGLVISHLRYLAQNYYKSESWKERSVYSLKLLITFINTYESRYEQVTKLLREFTRCIVTGTIDYESFTDKSGLYWQGRTITDANNILHHITHYTDFLALQEGYEISRINPFRKATTYEQRLNWCAYYHKQANVFLNHLSSKSDAYLANQKVRQINSLIAPHVEQEKAIQFPLKYLDQLLEHGFKVKEKVDYKSQAITMLLNYGGLRKSEVFHLYVSDITLHPTYKNEALVRVYHPEYGASPDPSFNNRNEYLQQSSSYKPRTQYRISERLYAGWKAPLLTSKQNFFEIIFSPAEKAQEFLIVWANYLKYQRVEPPKSSFHPFAFTNNKGEPETIKNYQRLHKNAVERIGLVCKKDYGTTEHGHRHAYGYRLRKQGLTQVEIQKAMHHKSPMSCLVYIQPSSDDVRDYLKEAHDVF
ncbi:MAG: site-specific integrase [Gammaproteobacteria bacterium]|nr:site-specific integrase [Gammaproteobacteria bacterium]